VRAESRRSARGRIASSAAAASVNRTAYRSAMGSRVSRSLVTGNVDPQIAVIALSAAIPAR
jgi:hypothetical protein